MIRDMDTHYVRAFAARAICGAISLHSSNPTCHRCVEIIESEAYTAYRSALPTINLWSAVPMPDDIVAALDQPYATAPCLDSSTANCVASAFDAARCRSCRRELQ